MGLIKFQEDAVVDFIKKLDAYEPGGNLFGQTDTPDKRQWKTPKPYIGHIHAVTGSGKTRILAALAQELEPCIVLWTTPRGSIIQQVVEDLQTAEYQAISKQSTVLEMAKELWTKDSWKNCLSEESGTTFLVGTVAMFNASPSDEASLSIHTGNPSPWERLKSERNRPLWVFYDEGHNATGAQLDRLLELKPKGFVLATAGDPKADILRLIPGNTSEAQQVFFRNERTTIVKTEDVVAAKLLKENIGIFKRNSEQSTILTEAVEKWKELAGRYPNYPIKACYIVEHTKDGYEVWQQLVNEGIDPKTIAFHCQNAEVVANQIAKEMGKANPLGLIDSHKLALKGRELSRQGFSHIIFNKKLEEGWDEPWAYIGYFHTKQANPNKIKQRVGRFIRNGFINKQEEPTLDLQTAYFFFNAEDAALDTFLTQFEKEMGGYGPKIDIYLPNTTPKSKTYHPSKVQKLPYFFLHPYSDEMAAWLLAQIDTFGKEESDAPGDSKDIIHSLKEGKTHTIKIGQTVHGEGRTVEAILKWKIRSIDPRYVKAIKEEAYEEENSGGWIEASIWKDSKFQQRIRTGSRAFKLLEALAITFCGKAKTEWLEVKEYTDGPIQLGSTKFWNSPNPNKYHIQEFKNSLHATYGDLQKFELTVANAIDELDILWSRNQPSQTGYAIPLQEWYGSSSKIYADFIIWAQGITLLLDSKGGHLLDSHGHYKLPEIPRPSVGNPLRLALLSSGTWGNINGRLVQNVKSGYTIVWRTCGAWGIAHGTTIKETIKETIKKTING